MDYAIETFALSKRFVHQRNLREMLSGSPQRVTVAVDRVSLSINSGEIFGILGTNGAGKTTLIKMLTTLLTPTSGRATVWGCDVVVREREVRCLVGLVTPDERSFYWRLTGRQNLKFFAALYNLHGKARNRQIDELLDLLDLQEVADIRFDEYSTGLRQRLAIGRALLSRPKILFMDEPTRGVDPISAQRLLAHIKERLAGIWGQTILITTHILSEAELLCHRIAFMDQGRVVQCGNLGDLQRDHSATQRYMVTAKRFTQELACKLRGMEGVRRLERVDGNLGFQEVSELALEIDVNQTDIGGILAQLINGRVEILGFRALQPSLNEIFQSILQETRKELE